MRFLQQVAAIIRRIIGAPDYATYVAHMQRRYPGCIPLDASAFEQERLKDRYSRPGSRCC
jgi:uncharacterized short protein YbdD (DUF466 family)